MSVVPVSDRDVIQFCLTHLPVWSADPEKLGLTGAQCDELAALTQRAREAEAAAEATRQAARAATATFQERSAETRAMVARMVKVIKAHGDSEQKEEREVVYSAAQIPLPAAPNRAPQAPSAPTEIGVDLNPGGSITLRWKARGCSPSTGCVFEVLRKDVGENGGGGYRVVGVGTNVRGGKFEFRDETVGGIGAASSAGGGGGGGGGGATYIIVGVRGAKRGEPSAAVHVQLGSAAGGNDRLTAPGQARVMTRMRAAA